MIFILTPSYVNEIFNLVERKTQIWNKWHEALLKFWESFGLFFSQLLINFQIYNMKDIKKVFGTFFKKGASAASYEFFNGFRGSSIYYINLVRK